MGIQASVFIVQALCNVLEACAVYLKERRVYGRTNRNMEKDIRNKNMPDGHNWQSLVDVSKNFDSWQSVTTKMFDDDIITTDRINILKIYTKDVCNNIDALEKDKIVKEFVIVLKDLKKRQSKARKNENLGKTPGINILRPEGTS